MQGLQVEHRRLNGQGSLPWSLAQDIYERSLVGKIAVVTDKPAELLSTTRKQWFKMIRRLQRERASTLNATRILELTRQTSYMLNLSFTAKSPVDDLIEANVTFATADDFARIPPACRTVFVTYSFEKEKLPGWRGAGVVVIYEESKV